MAVIGITPSNRLTDYLESVRRAGGEPRVLSMDARVPVAYPGDLWIALRDDFTAASQEISRPYHNSGPNAQTNGTCTSMWSGG